MAMRTLGLLMSLVGVSVSSMVWNLSNLTIPELQSTYRAFIAYHNNTIKIIGAYHDQRSFTEFPLNLDWVRTTTTTTIFGYQMSQSSIQINDQLWTLPDYARYLNSLDLNNLTITETVTFPGHAIKDNCVTSYNEYIFVTGGSAGGYTDPEGIIVNEFNIYNTFSRVWTSGTILLSPRAYHSCNVVGNTLYIIGGFDSSSGCNSIVCYLDTIEYLEINDSACCNGTWIQMADKLSTKKGWARSVTFKEDIYVIGGSQGNDVFFNQVDIIDTVSKTISSPSTNKLVDAKYGMSTIVIANVIYAFGGYPTDNNEYYQYAVIPTLSTTYAPTNIPIDLPTPNPTVSTNAPTPSSVNDPTTSFINDPTATPTGFPSDDSTASPSEQSTPTMTITSTTKTLSQETTTINDESQITNTSTTETNVFTEVAAREDLERTFHLFLYSLILFFIFISIIGLIHSKYIHQNDFFRISLIFSVGLQISDMCSDCFFVMNLSTHIDETGDSYFIATVISILLIVMPVIYSIGQLWHHLNKYWTNKNRINMWITQYSKYLYLLSFLTGSSFTSVSLLNCNFFTLSIFSMGLSKIEMTHFSTKRLHSTIIGENIPQIAIQIWYLYSSGNTTSYITVSSLIFSSISIIVTVLSLFNQKKIFNSQSRIKITMDVIGEFDPDKSSTRTLKIKKYFTDKVFGNNFVEILRPNKVRNGLRFEIELYLLDDDCNKYMLRDYEVILSNNDLADLIRHEWEIRTSPNIENIHVQQIASKYSSQISQYDELVYWSMDELGIGSKSNSNIKMVEIDKNDDDAIK